MSPNPKWTVVATSDTHGEHRSVKVPECDVFIHAGDYTGRDYSRAAAKEFLDWIDEQPASVKIFVPGNHDGFFSKPGWEEIVPHGVSVLIHDWAEFFGGQLKVFGSSWTPEFGRWYLTKPREELIEDWRYNASAIARTYGYPDILICHGPPRGILDTVYEAGGTLNVGCDGLRAALDVLKPRLGIFGHIHEALGQIEMVGRTVCMNASFMNEYYGLGHHVPRIRI